MWLWGKDETVMGPGAWSWYHIIWIFILMCLCFCLIYFFARKHNTNVDKWIIRIFAISLIVLELSKQILYTIKSGHYVFSEFPFDICSLPIYCLAISSFITNENNIVKKTCNCAAAYIGFIGGIAIMIYPAFVLKTPYVFKSIHTMLWHTLITSVGFYLLISKQYYKLKFVKTFIPTSIIFTIGTFIAIGLNEIIYSAYLLPNNLEKSNPINCFYIASHYNTSYPVLNLIKPNVPFPVFILIFLISLMVIIFLISFVLNSIYSLYNRRIQKK